MQVFPISVDPSMCVCKITNATDQWLIFNVYWDCHLSSLVDQLHLIKNLLFKFPCKQVLIVGDINTKNPLWGGSICDAKSQDFVDFLVENDLSICNNSDSLPTFQRGNCRSWIDITCVSLASLPAFTRSRTGTSLRIA